MGFGLNLGERTTYPDGRGCVRSGWCGHWKVFTQALAGSVFCSLGGRCFAQGRVDYLASTAYLHQHYSAAWFGMEQLDI